MAAGTNESAALLSVKQVAGVLGISTRHVWKLVASGRLPKCVRLSRSVRWRRADIEAFVAAGCDMAAFEAARRAGGRS